MRNVVASYKDRRDERLEPLTEIRADDMNPALLLSNDDQARARIRTSLDESLIVEASAGTGKTTELVHRIVGGAESRTREDRSGRGRDVHALRPRAN
jgi:superfamily I DNA/RNA helicase